MSETARQHDRDRWSFSGPLVHTNGLGFFLPFHTIIFEQGRDFLQNSFCTAVLLNYIAQKLAGVYFWRRRRSVAGIMRCRDGPPHPSTTTLSLSSIPPTDKTPRATQLRRVPKLETSTAAWCRQPACC